MATTLFNARNAYLLALFVLILGEHKTYGMESPVRCAPPARAFPLESALTPTTVLNICTSLQAAGCTHAAMERCGAEKLIGASKGVDSEQIRQTSAFYYLRTTIMGYITTIISSGALPTDPVWCLLPAEVQQACVEEALLRMVEQFYALKNSTCNTTQAEQHLITRFRNILECNLQLTDDLRESLYTAVCFYELTSSFGFLCPAPLSPCHMGAQTSNPCIDSATSPFVLSELLQAPRCCDVGTSPLKPALDGASPLVNDPEWPGCETGHCPHGLFTAATARPPVRGQIVSARLSVQVPTVARPHSPAEGTPAPSAPNTPERTGLTIRETADRARARNASASKALFTDEYPLPPAEFTFSNPCLPSSRCA